MYTLEKLIKLHSNDGNRLQKFDRVATFPYGRNAIKVCESEMLTYSKQKRS